MPEQEAANLQNSPVSVEDAVTGTPGGNIDDPGDFFAALDDTVNGAFNESPPPPQEQITSESPSPVADETPVTPQVANLERLEKRYSDSSREAKRLNNRLQELEPYAPILDRMRSDPNLIQTVRSYINGDQKQGVTDKLGLPEDFVFDSDEAFSKPNSDSAKVFNSVVNDRVSNIVGQYAKKERIKTNRADQERDFRNRYELSDEQWDNFVEYANTRKLSFDDIYYLMNREERDRTVANETRKEVSTQMKNVRQRPQSLAASGEQTAEETSVDDAVFDSILKVGMDDIFTN